MHVQFFIAFGWTFCIVLLLTVTLITYQQYHVGAGAPWSKADAIAYYTLNREAWAVAVGWIIFACTKGFGGYVILYKNICKLIP